MATSSELAGFESNRVDLEEQWLRAVNRAPRLATINNLRKHFGSKHEIDADAEWVTAEADPRPGTASIGIELEVWWSHILPAHLSEVLTSGQWEALSLGEKQAFNEAAEPIGFAHLARCQETVQLGIPSRGKDGLWEFSHQPVWHHRTLVEEVSQLVDAGLVPEGRTIPMHITLGGVEADDRIRFLLRSLELAGNSTRERLLKADEFAGWARRGSAGVVPRSRWKLEFGQLHGAEMRTLCFYDMWQLERLLSWAQNWGNVLRKTDEHDDRARVVWQVFEKSIETVTGMSVNNVRWIDPFSGRRQWDAHVQLLGGSKIAEEIKQILDSFVL